MESIFNPSSTKLPASFSSILSAYTSFAAVTMLLRSAANDLVPRELRSFISSAFRFLYPSRCKTLTFIVEENSGMTNDELYDAVEIYLRTKIGPSIDRLKINKFPKQQDFTFSILDNEEIIDHYEDFTVRWRFVCIKGEQGKREEKSFELTFDKKSKDKVVGSYLPDVLKRAEAIREDRKMVKIYNRGCQGHGGDHGENLYWGSLVLEHPASFDTIAMDSDLKKMIIDDLDRFVRRREFYKKVGRAWKRGYLLYGPPGTGKSTLIAAMANYLKFDIYDLELTSVYDNSDLKRVLLSTTNRSILVIEDVDCNSEVQDRRCDDEEDNLHYGYGQYGAYGGRKSNNKVTLSGLLNFIDGLWSSCGDERIIVFTTNYKERLDPALLRPGRMDLHINLSYCTPEAFSSLASTYLDVNDKSHRLYGEIEELITRVNVTPAEVAEELIRSEDVDLAFQGLLQTIRKKEAEAETATAATEAAEL
ncbi:AAA-ATPase At2g18193 [Linum perenne]